MSPHRTGASRLPASRLVASTSAALLLVSLGAGVAHADPAPPSPPPLPGADNPTTIPTGGPALPGGDDPAPGFSEPPDNIGDAEPPVEVDPHAEGLRLAAGAQLAPAKVLDIKFVTEDLGGTEMRADSNTKTTFTLQAEVLFSKDSAKLNGQARGRIADMADEIEAQHAAEVNVFGFTDDLGSYAHGEGLSKARANAVQQELAGHLGPEVTYRVRGYSEDYPIADNGTEAGRKKNRRVEVSFPRQD